MAVWVTCVHCKERFNRDKEPFVQVSARRYAHEKCVQTIDEQKTKEEHDRQQLEEYIKKLFSVEYVDPRIRKQIKQYVEQEHFTYRGIHQALLYFFEVQNGSIEKANGGIGIVPYVYHRAHQYYYALWEAQQKNSNKVIEEYKPKVKEITIQRPKLKPKKRNVFAFLDEELESDANGK